jgi:hypothetical protein
MTWTLLALFAVALAHQTLPHDHALHGGEGDSCALCLLLAATVLVAGSMALAVAAPAVAASESRPIAVPICRTAWTPCSRRGPPA